MQPRGDRARTARLTCALGALVGAAAGAGLAVAAVSLGPEGLRRMDAFATGIGGLLAGVAVGAVLGAAAAAALRRAGAVGSTALAAAALAPGVIALLIATGALWWRRDAVAVAVLVLAAAAIGAGGRDLALRLR